MKKLRRKETIQQKPRSKQQDEEGDDVNDPLSLIPLDLKTEILAKLPAKSVAKLISISKFWSSTIRSQDFTELYLARSSTQPRLLCMVHRRVEIWTQFFHSFSQEEAFSDHHTTQGSELLFDFSPPVRGLICCEDSPKVVISNPSTGQCVTLPRLKSKRSGLVTFLGYEPVSDVYKVLCMTVKGVRKIRGSKVVADEHQVFTLGAPKAAWRMIECKHPHLPPCRTKVLCRNGVVYYYAWINMDGCLISFDLRSEEFDVIKLPEDFRLLDCCDLVNYYGKVALTSGLFFGTLDLRVLEDANKQEWSKVYVLVPFWRDLFGSYPFLFRGALSNGELVFSIRCSSESFYIICYDPKKNNARKVVLEGIGGDGDGDCYQVFLDHVQSPMFLPKVR